MKSGEKLMVACIVFLLVFMAITMIVMMYTHQTNKKTDSIANNIEKTDEKEPENEEPGESEGEKIEIVPTMKDKIGSDAIWSPTFQLVWNDMEDEVVGQEIKFENGDEPDYLENLNAELFKEKDISEEYYYKKWGLKSNKLKDEIFDGIKEKFDETSDILNKDTDWGDTEEPNTYIFYAMLKRVFNFESPFDILDEGNFKTSDGTVSNVKYFGINENSDDELYDQVKILFYNSDDDFAISIATKENDEVILAKGVNGENFAEIYKNIEDATKEYDGDAKLASEDKLMIPNLKLNEKKEYKELMGKEFLNKNKEQCIITEALQSMKFELDNVGGEIKSEAVIEKNEALAAETSKPKLLYFDSEFSLFVKEKEKESPYFAVRVSNISKYQ